MIPYLLAIIVGLIIVEFMFPFFGFWEYVYNFNNISLNHNVIGCTAQFTGSELVGNLLTCVSSKHSHFDPLAPTINLGRKSVHWMVKNRKSYNVFYETKHYSDLLAYAPVLGDFRSVVVLRHPMDRIIAMVNQYRTSLEPWLFDSSIYETNSRVAAGQSFQQYISSLNSSDALLYGIYVSSQFFDKEIEEIGRLRNAAKAGASPSAEVEVIRLEDLNSDFSRTIVKVGRALDIDLKVLKSCTPTLISDKKKLLKHKYSYIENYECSHYLYFEMLMGADILQRFGYDDDLTSYGEAKRVACKNMKPSDNTLSKRYVWPSFNMTVFTERFTGYEFKLRKLKRLGGGKIESLNRVDLLKSSNHELLVLSNSSISLADSKTIHSIELSQILNSTALDLFCPKDKYNKNLTYDQSQTRKYLTYIKRSNEYRSLSRSEKSVRVTDESFPLNQPDSWVHIFCPEVLKYFKDYKVGYFDFYPSSHEDPLTTTEAAITMVCLLKVVSHVAEKVDAKWALFVGTQLGALLHGGPIPWDDDIDILLEATKGEKFINALEAFSIGSYKIACSPNIKARRCYIDNSKYRFYQNYKWDHHWPFIDVFFYYSGDEIALEYMQNRRLLTPSDRSSRRLNSKVWRIEDFFPFRQTFYGGIMLPTLRLDAALLHYDINKCFNGLHNHRIDKILGLQYQSQLNCCEFAKYFPFVRRIRSRAEIGVELEVLMINDRPIHLSRVNIETGQVINSFFLQKRQRVGRLRDYTGSTNVTDSLTYTHHLSQ